MKNLCEPSESAFDFGSFVLVIDSVNCCDISLFVPFCAHVRDDIRIFQSHAFSGSETVKLSTVFVAIVFGIHKELFSEYASVNTSRRIVGKVGHFLGINF